MFPWVSRAMARLFLVAGLLSAGTSGGWVYSLSPARVVSGSRPAFSCAAAVRAFLGSRRGR